MSAIDEFLEYNKKQKQASNFDPNTISVGMQMGASGGDWKRTLGQAALGAAAVYGIGAGIGLLSKGIEGSYAKVTGDIERARGFRTMLKENPDLAQFDKDKTQKIYRSLHKFQPDMATDPFVSGSFVRRVHEIGAIDPTTIAQMQTGYQKGQQAREGQRLIAQGLPAVVPGMNLAQQVNEPYATASKARALETVLEPIKMRQAGPLAYEQQAARDQAMLQSRMRLVGVKKPEDLLSAEAGAEAVHKRLGEAYAMTKATPMDLEYQKALAVEKARKEVEVANATTEAIAKRQGQQAAFRAVRPRDLEEEKAYWEEMGRGEAREHLKTVYPPGP